MIKLTSKYIIRLDDACHQMPNKKWQKFETYFVKNGIKPIVGVIPENKDEALGEEFDHNFWERVRNWENFDTPSCNYSNSKD